MAVVGPAIGWVVVMAWFLMTRPVKPGGIDLIMVPALLFTIPFAYLFGLLPAVAAGLVHLVLNARRVGPARDTHWYPMLTGALAGAVGCTPALFWAGEADSAEYLVAVGAVAGAGSVYIERRSRSPVAYSGLLAFAPIIVLVCLAILAAALG